MPSALIAVGHDSVSWPSTRLAVSVAPAGQVGPETPLEPVEPVELELDPVLPVPIVPEEELDEPLVPEVLEELAPEDVPEPLEPLEVVPLAPKGPLVPLLPVEELRPVVVPEWQPKLIEAASKAANTAACLWRQSPNSMCSPRVRVHRERLDAYASIGEYESMPKGHG